MKRTKNAGAEVSAPAPNLGESTPNLGEYTLSLDGEVIDYDGRFDEAEFLRLYHRPWGVRDPEKAVPLKVATPAPVVIPGDTSRESQMMARHAALALLEDASMWNARARWSGAAWQVSYERRTSPRQEKTP